jgi:hypothetical protein
MYLSNDVKAKIVQFEAKYPLPRSTNNEEFQTWTHRVCQQLKYSFPNDGWGHKSAGPGRPHSSDVICTESPFIGWDIVLNAGSLNPQLVLSNESIDLTGQVFEQVTAADFLGSTPPPDPPTGTVDEKLNLIIAKLNALDKKMDNYLDREMEAITAPRITRIA